MSDTIMKHCEKHDVHYTVWCIKCAEFDAATNTGGGSGQLPQGTKFDTEKPRMELLSTVALTEISKVLSHGAKKYDAHNWRKGMAWSRLLGAAMRHLMAFIGGEDKDPESGLSHLSHLGCCVLFLLEYEVTKKNLDDRYKQV